jgi:hypothetical protein
MEWSRDCFKFLDCWFLMVFGKKNGEIHPPKMLQNAKHEKWWESDSPSSTFQGKTTKRSALRPPRRDGWAWFFVGSLGSPRIRGGVHFCDFGCRVFWKIPEWHGWMFVVEVMPWLRPPIIWFFFLSPLRWTSPWCHQSQFLIRPKNKHV